jgi:hypothetical protein
MNAPFVILFVALLVSTYATVSTLSGEKVTGISAAMLLGTLPLLTLHIALPGYADVAQGIGVAMTAYASALAIVSSRTSRRHALYFGAVTILCLICVSQIKRPGIFWAIGFFPALAWVVVRRFQSKISTLLFVVAALAIGGMLYVFDSTAGYGIFKLMATTLPNESNLGLLVSVVFFHSDFLVLPLLLLLVTFVYFRNGITDTSYVVIFLTPLLFIGTIVVGMAYYQNAEFWSTVTARAFLHAIAAMIGLSGALLASNLNTQHRSYV